MRTFLRAVALKLFGHKPLGKLSNGRRRAIVGRRYLKNRRPTITIKILPGFVAFAVFISIAVVFVVVVGVDVVVLLLLKLMLM
jgi:hypothetical protein